MAKESESKEPEQLRIALELTNYQYAAINKAYGESKALCCGCKKEITTRKLVVTQPRSKWSWGDEKRLYVYYFCDNCCTKIQDFFTKLREQDNAEPRATTIETGKKRVWPGRKITRRTGKVRSRRAGRTKGS